MPSPDTSGTGRDDGPGPPSPSSLPSPPSLSSPLPSATCSFPASAAAVPDARRWARHQLRGWALPAGVLDIAELLLSEIATNAVTHTHGRRIAVRLVLDGDLHVAVHDDDARRQPHLMHPHLVDTSGRGLVLVRALASAWGTLPDPAGKWVWFRVPLAR